jgi:hypothetical protein
LTILSFQLTTLPEANGQLIFPPCTVPRGTDHVK